MTTPRVAAALLALALPAQAQDPGLKVRVLVGTAVVLSSESEGEPVPVVELNTSSAFTVAPTSPRLVVDVRFSGEPGAQAVLEARSFRTLEFAVGLRKRLRGSHRFAPALQVGAVGRLGAGEERPRRYYGAGIAFEGSGRGSLLLLATLDERLDGTRRAAGYAQGAVSLANGIGPAGISAWMFGRAVVGGSALRAEVGLAVAR